MMCSAVTMQTVAVAKEGAALNTKDARLLVVMCTITVLPGNPTKLVLEGEDWETVRVKVAQGPQLFSSPRNL